MKVHLCIIPCVEDAKYCIDEMQISFHESKYVVKDNKKERETKPAQLQQKPK